MEIRDKVIQEYRDHPGKTNQEIAREIGCTDRYVRKVLNPMRETVEITKDEYILKLKKELNGYKKELKSMQEASLTTKQVRQEIFGLKQVHVKFPDWMIHKKHPKSRDVPTLMLSDWHYSEIISSSQVEHLNSFNLEIANNRIYNVINNAIHIVDEHLGAREYPGLVLPLMGDMFSGDIHEELMQTNEKPLMPAFVDLYGMMIWSINQLKGRFGSIFIPCVIGNHSRNTRKVAHKDAVYSNFDWLLYTMLEKYYEEDLEITFQVSDCVDTTYKIFDWVFRMTHGNQFRGGNGIMGPKSAIAWGDAKKRRWTSQVGRGYHNLLVAHFHQPMPGYNNDVICNGSLKGYDEYALANNYPYCPPVQNLFITNDRYGITINAPIHCESIEEEVDTKSSWVSIPEK